MLEQILQWFKGPVIYVRVSENRMHIRDCNSGEDVLLSASEPFTTDRLLVGNFASAEALLREGLDRLYKGSIFVPSPTIVIHPQASADGGLSPVEERIFNELAVGAGARRAVLWVGRELADIEVLTRARPDK